MKPYSLITLLIKNNFTFLYNRELSGFTVLQLLILWNRNDYCRMFNLPFAISILFKTLQVLIVSVPLSVLVFIFILFFVGRPRNEVMGSTQHSQIRWE
jgi:hypothetical protein